MKTICVQKCKLGTTEYYLAKMPAGELTDTVGLAAELPEWEEMTPDEKMQREPDIYRVVNEIVPYFVKDEDRFFGCVIVDIYSGYENLVFEPITNIVQNLNAAYQIPLKDVGFLSLPGKERLIALDGQHRILAIKIAIKGKVAIPAEFLKNKKMTPQMAALEPHPELATEEISVIFVEHRDNLKIRKIFNKVNKYARQTGRGDNIITSDDDVFALISRRLFSKGETLEAIDGNELVNWKSNTLSERSNQLTTISALYTSAEILLKDYDYSAKVLPPDDDIKDAYVKVRDFWRGLVDGLDAYKEYRRRLISKDKKDKKVSDLRKETLLLKPVTQMALAHVAYYANSKGIDWDKVVKRLNRVNWSFDNKAFFNLLVTGTAKRKMITGKESIKEAGQVISYMVMGDRMSKSEIQEIRNIISVASNNVDDTLPDMITGEAI